MNRLFAKTKLQFLFLSAIVFFAFTQNINAQSRSETMKRVQFARGKNTATIKGSVAAAKNDTYIFRANENQSITVELEWLGGRKGPDEGISGFVFVHPDGTEEEDPQSDVFVAGASGDYKVVIRTKSRRSTTKYVFKLTIQ